jgi:formiminotetrahydrofolate cyclodeaminase
VRGAWLNVRTNAKSVQEQRAIAGIMAEGAKLEAEAAKQESEILAIVEQRMGS